MRPIPLRSRTVVRAKSVAKAAMIARTEIIAENIGCHWAGASPTSNCLNVTKIWSMVSDIAGRQRKRKSAALSSLDWDSGQRQMNRRARESALRERSLSGGSNSRARRQGAWLFHLCSPCFLLFIHRRATAERVPEQAPAWGRQSPLL